MSITTITTDRSAPSSAIVVRRRAAPAERPALGYVQVLAGAALFGLGASVSKVVLTAGVEPSRLTALRCTGAALGLLVVLLVTRPSGLRIAWRDLPLLIAIGLSGAAFIQWLYFIALERLPVGIALLLEFTAPLMIALHSRVVLRQAVSGVVWWALGLALGGLALVAHVWGGGGLDPIGAAAALGAAVCLAAFYLLSKRALRQHDPVALSFWMFAIAAVFWALVQPWWRLDPSSLTQPASLLGSLGTVSVPVWVPLVWLVLLGTLLPYALEIASLHHLSPTTTGIAGMSEPVLAAAIAWLWLGQALAPIQLVGAAFVLAGIVLVQRRL
jgi:drug/metabolite transporter (DMT)-like permease